jgi:hypothetical protein
MVTAEICVKRLCNTPTAEVRPLAEAQADSDDAAEPTLNELRHSETQAAETPCLYNDLANGDNLTSTLPELQPTAAKEATSGQEEGGNGPTECMEVSTTMRIVQLVDRAKVQFLQDQHGEVFAWIPTMEEDRHWECLRLNSRAFRARVLDLVHAGARQMPSPKAIRQAIEILELQAYSSRRVELANRRTVQGNRTLLDLGDPGWRMIAVTTEGWKVEPQSEPLFYRAQHQHPLIEPVGGSDPMELFTFLPVDTKEEELLIMTWALAALYPAIPNPILLFVGDPGSAKTTRSRRLRSLLDPSVIPVLGGIEMSNLFLTFQHHAVPCFENVSHFKRKEADMFCRAVTGNGVQRRKLYTDSDQTLYSFRRPIIINGIDIPSARADFLDRCLVVNCRRIDKFRTLQELDQQFEAARPRLLGTLLDLLVQTLRLYESTPTADDFRMADFARFGRAVARALGQDYKCFDAAYQLNIRQQGCEILEDSPMARLLKTFCGTYMESKPWRGTAEELLEKLNKVAKDTQDADARKDLPLTARWLSSRLGELAPAFATRGIVVTKLKRTNVARLWEIFKASPVGMPDIAEAIRNEMKGGESHE